MVVAEAEAAVVAVVAEASRRLQRVKEALVVKIDPRKGYVCLGEFL